MNQVFCLKIRLRPRSRTGNCVKGQWPRSGHATFGVNSRSYSLLLCWELSVKESISLITQLEKRELRERLLEYEATVGLSLSLHQSNDTTML